VGVVAGAFDDLEARVGYASRESELMLGREQEVVPSRDHQRRYRDLAEPVHHGPAVEELAASEDERFGSRLRAPPAPDHFACQHSDAGVVVVRTTEFHQGG